MATNEVFRDADHITLPVVSGVVSGEVVVVGVTTGWGTGATAGPASWG